MMTNAATIEQAETPNVRTQFLIFTLFGDYILPRGGAIWAASLLALLDLLGVSERAARSALSRMASRGWLIARKQGRRSQYSLTAQGRLLLERSERRIFEPPYADWDGLWHMVIYSLPESKRDLRHALRTQLIWLGFGPLAPATWVSPRDRRAEVEAVCHELGVRDCVDLFSGLYQRSTSDRALIERCWDLPALEAEYRQFIARYEAEYADLRSLGAARLSAAPDMCFARRFWITHEFQRFPRQDPGLPVALLPPSWIGFSARQLFDGYRQLLGPYANQFVDKVIHGEVLSFEF
ncbi:MAG: PaaX family transcriptional regulator C-terminal domain-containing protein [Roseiflexaceae bacterium]